MKRLVTSARCLNAACPWTAAGGWEAVDAAAGKHTAPGRATATETKWDD